MTRKNDIIDNIFRDSLDGYMDESPSANVWKNISRKLLMKDILKFSFMRLGVLLILLLASLSFFIPSNLIKEKTGISYNKSSQEKVQVNKISQNNIKDKDILAQKTLDNETKSIVNNNTEYYKSKTANPVAKPINKKISKENSQDISTQTVKEVYSPKQYDSDISIKTNVSTFFAKKTDLKETPSNNEIDNFEEIPNVSLVFSKDFRLGLIHFDENLEFESDNYRNIISQNQLTEKLPLPEGFNNSPFEPEKPQLSIDIWGSPLWSNKALSTNKNLYTDHIAQRNTTEKSLINYSIGVDLKINYKNWLLITGLNYSEYSEKADYSLFSSNIDSNSFITYKDASYWEYDTLDIIYDPIDSTIWYPIIYPKYILDSVAITGVDYDTTFANTNYSFLNTYKWIEIPILVGREFSKDRFTFSIATGISYGFLTGTTGSILHYDNRSIIAIDKNKAPFKNSMFNYILQAGIDYTITKKIGVVCKPMFRYNLNSMFDKTYPIDQRYYSLGVNCGLRYKF
ncbi:MAG: hypothetical protein K9J13_02295 [Saprospiraceae bacterium]|nr:hypothetical protein [Saprospiraceae bacterium]